MKQTTFQHPELRDENDNIIQQGAFGKNTALANATNDGWIDYVANDLEALYDNITGGDGSTVNADTITGKTATITDITATTVNADTITGALTGNLTGNVTGTADKATADAAGNNIQNTYAKKSDLSSSVSTTSLTVSGTTSVPTANAGNSSKAIANTEFVSKSISALVNGAPDQLNTLNELAKALGNDADFSTTVTNAIAAKVAKAGDTITGDVDITGNLSVSGAITGNVTGNVTGTATRATKDGNGKNIASTYLPAVVGAVVAFAGRVTPQGWLLCDGSAVSRKDYAALYAVIGTTYGAGNGSTTFNLPNLADRFIQGNSTVGTVKSAGLPNITGGLIPHGGVSDGSGGTVIAKVYGAFVGSNLQNNYSYGSNGHSATSYGVVSFAASYSNSIYGNSNTVQPPALTMRYIIKY